MSDEHSRSLTVALVIVSICLLLFVYLTAAILDKYNNVRRALKNSEIVCEPVKVNNDYFCSTTILVNVHGVDDTFSIDKVDIDE